jgi:hypothetical protein
MLTAGVADMLGHSAPLATALPADSWVMDFSSKTKKLALVPAIRAAHSDGDRCVLLMRLPATPPRRERRSKQRFPIRMNVTYEVLTNRSNDGRGCTLDISSAAVRFTTDAQLSPGDLVKVTASWPVLLSGTAPLQLIIGGPVVRVGSAEAVVAIRHYEYRTRGAKRI